MCVALRICLFLLVSRYCNSQYRLTVYVLQRPVNAMGARIDRDRVSIRREETFKDFSQTAFLFVKDGDVPAFRRHIKSTKASVKGKHIRIGSYRKRGSRFLALQIEDDKFRVLFTGGKCQAVFRIDQ